MFKSSKALLGIVVISAIAIGLTTWKSPTMASAPDISKKTEQHILYGDKTGGGHLYGSADPCKSKFPKDWNKDDVLENIQKVAANDNLKWEKEKNGYYTATDSVDGVKIRVVLDKEKDDVVTGYPLNGSANRCAKPVVRKSAARKKSAPAKVQVEAAAEQDNDAPIANASNRKPRTQNFNAN